MGELGYLLSVWLGLVVISVFVYSIRNCACCLYVVVYMLCVVENTELVYLKDEACSSFVNF